MIDVVAYCLPVRVARASAVLAMIDANNLPGKISIYHGVRPSIKDAPSSSRLVELVLAKPCGAVNEQGEIVFAAVADAMVVSSGVATWSRISDGAGSAVADFDVGLPGSGAAIILASTDLMAGAMIRVTLAKLIEP